MFYVKILTTSTIRLRLKSQLPGGKFYNFQTLQRFLHCVFCQLSMMNYCNVAPGYLWYLAEECRYEEIFWCTYMQRWKMKVCYSFTRHENFSIICFNQMPKDNPDTKIILATFHNNLTRIFFTQIFYYMPNFAWITTPKEKSPSFLNLKFLHKALSMS